LASEDEVLAVIGTGVGTVSPLGFSHPIRILADDIVFKPDEVSIGSGMMGGNYYEIWRLASGIGGNRDRTILLTRLVFGCVYNGD